MTQPLPRSVPADGSVKVLWVPAIAVPAAPTLAELTDPSVVDLSCYLTDNGLQPNLDEQASTDNRLCSRQTLERRGRHTYSLDLVYVYLGQEMAAADNRAFSTLRAAELGFVVQRFGMDYEMPVALADLVDVWPAECGEQQKQAPEANGRLRLMQKIFIRGRVEKDVPVVAGS